MLAELDTLFDANASQAKGLAAIYQTLLGGVPNIGGFTYLIEANNASNFGAGVGSVFNDENIYINIANSLVQGNATAKAAFDALSVGSTLKNQVEAIYKALIPVADQTVAGLEFITRPEGLAFYTAVAAERGITSSNGAAIVAFASILKIAVDEDIGVGDAVNDLIAAVNDGTAVLPDTGTDLTPIEDADGTGFDGDDTASGATFTLTVGADAGAAFTGGPGEDTFVATDKTLTPSDSLDGAQGNDSLIVATNIAVDTTLAGFELKSIEDVRITADGIATKVLTFDVTGVTGAQTLTNSNSSIDLRMTGVANIIDIALENVSGGDTMVVYDAPVVAGTNDTQKISLMNVNDVTDAAASAITVNGIENVAVNVTGTEGSKLTDIASNSAKSMTISGDQNLTITDDLNGFGTVDATGFKGNLDVILDDIDLTATGGSGNDIFRTEVGDTLNNKDSFDGGDGIDTVFVDNAVAVAGPTSTYTSIEQLGLPNALNGTIDMAKFVGINKVIGDGGIGGTSAFINVENDFAFDVKGALGNNNLTIDHKVDGASDTASLNVDILTDQFLGTVTINDAETINIDADSDDGKDTLGFAKLISTDVTTLNITGDAHVSFDAATTENLATIEAGTSAGNLVLDAFGNKGTALTINTGSGDDSIIGSTKGDTINAGAGKDTIVGTTGADTLTGGADADVFFYSASSAAATAALSNNANGTDTITDFKSGEDRLNLDNLILSAGGFSATVSAGTTSFVGSQSTFALAQGALRGGGKNDVVYQADQNILWVDTDGNGTLDDNDFRIVLTGAASITAQDVGVNLPGVTFTANTGPFQTSDVTDSVEGTKTGNGTDMINATAAQLAGSNINGGFGVDTLNVTTVFTGGAISTLAVETVSLLLGSTANTTFNAGVTKVITAKASIVDFGAGTVAFTGSSEDDTVNNSTGLDSVDAKGGNDTVNVAAGAQTGALNGGDETDILNLATGSDITGSTVTNFELANVSGNVSMNSAHHNGFTQLNGITGADQIFLSGAGDVTASATIETYRLSSAANTFSINPGAVGVNLIENGANNQTVNIGGLAITGNYVGFDGGAGGDILVATNSANLAGAQGGGGGAGTALGFGVLKLAGAITMSDQQFAAFNTTAFAATIVATGANSVTVTDTGGTALTEALDSDIGTLIVQGDDSNVINLASGAQNVTFVGTGTDTVSLSNGVFTGNLNGGAGADILNLVNGTDISNIGSITSFESVNLGTGTITMTAAQITTFTAFATANFTAAGTTTVNVSDNGALTINNDGAPNENDPEIETYNFQGTTNTISLIDLTSSAALNVILSAGGANVITLTNTTHEPTASNSEFVISGFEVGTDDLLVQHGGTAYNAGFQTISATGTDLAVGADSIVEITTATTGDLHATGAGLSIENIIAAAITDASGLANSDDLLMVIYDAAGNAGIYDVDVVAATADMVAGNITIELIGILNGVGFGNLTAADFA